MLCFLVIEVGEDVKNLVPNYHQIVLFFMHCCCTHKLAVQTLSLHQRTHSVHTHPLSSLVHISLLSLHCLDYFTIKRFSFGLSSKVFSNFPKDSTVILSWDPVIPITCSCLGGSVELLHYKSLCLI